MPPLEPPDCSDIPMPAPAKIPPIILAASASWISGVDGIGIKLKNSVWLNTHTSVRKKNGLPIQINANAQFNKVFSLEPYVEDGFTPIQILVTRDNRLLVQGREKDSSPAVYETTLPASQEGPASSLSS